MRGGRGVNLSVAALAGSIASAAWVAAAALAVAAAALAATWLARMVFPVETW